MQACVFLGPLRCRVLLDEWIDVRISWVDHANRAFGSFHLHSEEIKEAAWFVNLKTCLLLIRHAKPCMLSSYSEVFATIDVDALACDFSWVLRSKMNNSHAYFFNRSCSLHWVCIDLFMVHWRYLILGQTCLSVKICVHVGGRYTVNSHTKSCQLKGCRFAHHFERSFGHAVRNETWLWFGTFEAANINDNTLPSDKHILKEVKQNVWSSSIEVHAEVMILRESIVKITCKNPPSTVDEYV